MSAPEVRPLGCPRCARKYTLEERFCSECEMPLVYVGRGEEEPITEAHERARKVKPQFTGGRQIRVASAGSLAEAELIQGILLEEGIPSVQRRTRGFDVPDFLAAGPRDVLVPEAGVEAASDLLADLRPDGPKALVEPSGERPLRLLVGILIGLAGAAALVWLLFSATSASAAPITSTGTPPSLPAFRGHAVEGHPDPAGDDRAPEPVHGAEPRQQHPRRHLDDGRLSAQGAARKVAGRRLARACPRRCADR